MGEFMAGLLALYLIAFVVYVLVLAVATYWYLLPIIAVILISFPLLWIPLYRRSDGFKTFADGFAVFTFVYTLPLGIIGFLAAQRSVGIYRLLPGGFAAGEAVRMVLPPILAFALVWSIRRVAQQNNPPGFLGYVVGLMVVCGSVAPLAAAANGRLWGDPADVPAATADGVIEWFWRVSAIGVAGVFVLFVIELVVRRS